MPDRLRSPLAMVVLAMLVEGPMHAYRIHELIKERGKDAIVNVAQRNSVYQAIDRLLREGLVCVHATLRAKGRPERVSYRVTKEGTRILHEWLRETLAAGAREYPQFPAGLAFLMLMKPKDALSALEERRAMLEEQVDAETKALRHVHASGLPRLFVLDDEYRHAMTRAELAWLRALVSDLRAKKITWSESWLCTIANEFGKQG